MNPTDQVSAGRTRRWSRIQRDCRGVAAVEFGIVAMFLLVLLTGSIDVSQMLMANRKVSAMAASMVDLAGRMEVATKSDVDDLFIAGQLVMPQAQSQTAGVRLSSISRDTTGDHVGWSVSCGTLAAYQTGATVQVPPDILQDGESVLVVEVQYSFKSELNFVIEGERILADVFYQRPRVADEVQLGFAPEAYSCPWA